VHQILETFKNEGSLHHAYLITGDITENIAKLQIAIEKIIGSDIGAYPDYHLHFTPAFTVHDSRDFIDRQKTKSFGGGKRFFVLASYSFNNIAQNGLLKVLEDPIADNHFFILTTKGEALLPTLRSRLLHIEGAELNYDNIEDWCSSFIKADVTNRLVMIEKLLKEYKEEDDKQAKQKVKDILNQIEKVFADKIRKDEASQKQDAHFLSELIRMKGYLNDTAPALRLILEYIAFTCPA
jgi:hypothetical protein